MVRTQIADRPQMYPPQSSPPEIIGTGDGVTTTFSLTYENTIPGTLTIYTAPAPGLGALPVFTAFSATAPIGTVAATSAAAEGPGVVTITPSSMTNITGKTGYWLRLDQGLATQEDVQITATTGTTFTCNTIYAHAAGFSIIGTPAYSQGAPATGTDNTAATTAVITFLTAPASGVLIGQRSQVTAFSDSDLTNYLGYAESYGYPDDNLTLKRVHFDIIPVILGDQRRLQVLSEGAFKTDPSVYAAQLTRVRAELAADLEGGPLPQTAIPQFGVVSNAARRYTPYK